MSQSRNALSSIDSFIREVGAFEKRASTLSEPGSQGGETSHPVKDVDDGLEVAQEGARSAENTSDVKEDQGVTAVDNAPIAKAGEDGGAVSSPGSAADDHYQINANVQATGDDSESETGSAKAGKNDPGSAHPARTDNESLDGNKYSSDRLLKLPIEQLAKIAADLGDEVCAAIAVDTTGSTKQASAPAKPVAKPAPKAQPTEESVKLAHQAGWEVGGLLDGEFDKQAADALVEEKLYQTIKTASADADNVANYIFGFYKQAEEDMAAAGGPPPMDPAAGGMPPMDPAAGGMPPMDPAAGGDMGGDMGGEGGGDGEALAKLESLLAEQGMTLEDLVGMLEGGGQPGGEGGAPAGPAPSPVTPAAPPELDPAQGMEAQASDRRRRTSVKKGHSQADVANYVREVISRSKR